MAITSPFTMVAAGASPPPPRRITQGTDEQEAIWAQIQDRLANLVINALAGCGKSTTAREGMWRAMDVTPDVRIRYTCFNKAIADEFARGCPPGVDVGTMHSFGFRALVKSFGSTVDKNKTYTILDTIPAWQGTARNLRRTVSQLVSLAKNHAVTDPHDVEAWDLVDDLIDWFDIQVRSEERDKVVAATLRVLARSAEMTSVVDFDDMLLLPLIHRLPFPACDLLFIDECQDMNAVQHQLVPLLNPSGVTVVIGDPNQSIYAFRGADSNSMSVLADQLKATVLPLTMTFRCPQSHVRLASKIVSGFRAHPTNPEGTLFYAEADAIEQAKPGDLVLCRANAPLVKQCLSLIARQVPAYMRGRAIGDSLEALIRKADRGVSRTVEGLIGRVEDYRRKEVARLDAKEGSEDLIEQLNDRCRAVEAIASSCDSPARVTEAITALFSDSEPGNRVTFSSIHRAKGSEARNVWLIDKPYAPPRLGRGVRPSELRQRSNLRYVGLTRSLDSLTILTCPPESKENA